jgi:hypothetical protein
MLENSPWLFLNRFGLPNVKWCEVQVPSWVLEPANTWSNLAFLVAGLSMYFFIKKTDRIWLKIYPLAMILLAFASGIYHASYTFIFQLLDFVGMFAVLMCPLFISLERLGKVFPNPIKLYLGSIGALTIMTYGMYLAGIPFQSLIAVLAIVIVGAEFKLWKNETPTSDGKTETNRPFFFAIVSFLVVGETFSALDVSRNFCHPEDHLIQGHAIHHVLVAICFFFNFLYCRQALQNRCRSPK